MLKAWQAMSHYVLPTLLEEGLGASDFRVLEVLLHKGPMAVNAIGPKVDINPGSVSVAVGPYIRRGLSAVWKAAPIGGSERVAD